MEEKKWLDRNLRTHYMGVLKGNYDDGCPLFFKEINNFIQNVGRYGDLEIFRIDDYETLLNTCGIFIDRIWPEIKWGNRTNETMENANYVAYQFQKQREIDGYFPTPLPKVQRFIDDVVLKMKEQDVSNEMKME